MADIALNASLSATSETQVRLGRTLGLGIAMVGSSGQGIGVKPMPRPAHPVAKPTLKIADFSLTKGS